MSLEVKNLTFAYKGSDRKILNNFSQCFSSHEITALTGKNGAGKSTLAKVIMGILHPDKGDIFFDGKKINDFTLAQRGRIIGYVMQNPARQIFSSTVEEEMGYGLQSMGISEDETEMRVQEYLERFGLEDKRKSFPFALSQGEKQRLVLAAVLAMKPTYLILDEPTTGLDFKRKKILGQFLEKAECGIMVISHDLDFVRIYCDKAVRLGDNYE